MQYCCHTVSAGYYVTKWFAECGQRDVCVIFACEFCNFNEVVRTLSVLTVVVLQFSNCRTI